MRPSVTQYRLENGRRYHAYKDGTYWHELLPTLELFLTCISGLPTMKFKMKIWTSGERRRYPISPMTRTNFNSHHRYLLLLDGKLLLAPVTKDIKVGSLLPKL